MAKDIVDATLSVDDLNVCYGGGNSALHLATFLGYRDVVRRLLERGADPQLKVGVCVAVSCEWRCRVWRCVPAIVTLIVTSLWMTTLCLRSLHSLPFLPFLHSLPSLRRFLPYPTLSLRSLLLAQNAKGFRPMDVLDDAEMRKMFAQS